MSRVPMLTSQELLDSSHIFQEDCRMNKPQLHMLYTTQAVEHLRAIDVAMQSFCKFSNTNMHNILGAMHQERLVLVRNNAAYCQADAILQSLGLAVNTVVVSADGESPHYESAEDSNVR